MNDNCDEGGGELRSNVLNPTTSTRLTTSVTSMKRGGHQQSQIMNHQ